MHRGSNLCGLILHPNVGYYTGNKKKDAQKMKKMYIFKIELKNRRKNKTVGNILL